MVAKRNSQNNKQQSSFPWGVMFLGVAVGVFVMFLIHLKDNVPADEKGKEAAEEISRGIEPTFDFYTLLPEMEVVVDTPKPSQQVVVTPPQQTIDSTEKISYLLQVGSFKNLSDADGFRARLALLGIESKVQTVTIDNKDTWHRVQVGPIIGRDKVDALQTQLKQNSIDSLLMRAKHS